VNGRGYNLPVRTAAVLLLMLSLVLVAQAQSDPPAAVDSAGVIRSGEAAAVLSHDPGLASTNTTREQLEDILSRPEYQGEDEPPAERDDLWNRFLAWLAGLLGLVGLGGASWIGVVAVVTIVALLLYLLVRLIWQQAGRRSHRAVRGEPDAERMGLDALLATAMDAAGRGDFRVAIRYRYLALLRQLEVPTSALLTNTQMVQRLKKNRPLVAAPFGELVKIFEDTWYGGLACGAEQHRRVLALGEQVSREVVGDGDE